MNANVWTGTAGGLRIRVQACGESILRITQTANPSFRNRDYNITTGECPLTETVIFETAESCRICAGQLSLTLCKKTGGMTLSDAQGKCYGTIGPCTLSPVEVTRNSWEHAVVEESSGIDGARAAAEGSQAVFDRIGFRGEMPLSFGEEGIFGFGSFEEGYGNLRGKKRYIYQQNMRACVPMLVSTLGYGILFNCGCSMVFDDRDTHTLTLDCVDELDVYFMGGGSHQAVLENYYRLTGRPPMLPKYIFGYIQSKERYTCARELIQVLSEYRRREIPLDVIVQDWMTWEDGQWGQKSFDPARYPDPAAMTEEIHRQHGRLMLSVWPIMTGKGENREEMLRHGYMLGNQAIYDAFRPEARTLYWEQARRGLFRYGVDCWWCDCTEPFEADWSGELRLEDEARYQKNTGEAKKYLDWDRISLYSLYHAQGIYEGMRGCSDKRVVNLARSSYAGQHRYATITWSGDISAKWETLRRHIPEGVNFTCTGEPYWSFDTGGFFVQQGNQWFLDGDFDQGMEDLGYRELYVRWLEYAVFTPIFRAHGTATPREIWRLGEEGTPFYDAAAKYIRLRYQLLPYIYSLAAGVTFRAGSMMRPLGLEFPRDSRARDILDAYMFGDFLVCPVTEPFYFAAHSEPLEGKEKTRPVYLPEGLWYDYHTGRRLTGGRTVSAPAPLDVIPLYLRAGTILVTAPVMQYTGQLQNPPLTVTVYDGADGSFILYQDDGETYGYESGEYEEIRFDWNDQTGGLTIAPRKGAYPGMPAAREFHIGRASAPKPLTLTYTGREVTVFLEKPGCL